MQTTPLPRKAYKGMAMEGAIATWYAKNTLKDLKRHKLMAAQLVNKIPPGGHVLEIAPGPGYFCIELAKLGKFEIAGLDISKSFVEMASKSAAEAGVRAEFRQGDAANMPFADATFDFAFCQAAFKNFSQPAKAIVEIHRVLRTGGLGLIVDLRHDAPREAVNDEVNGMGLSLINRALTRWTFDVMLLKSAYTLEQMRGFVAETPFGTCRIDEQGIGFTVWLQK